MRASGPCRRLGWEVWRLPSPGCAAGAALVSVASALFGCAVNLNPDASPSPPPPSAAVLASCLPLEARAAALEGRVGALALPDGMPLFTAENATIDGRTAPTGFESADATACLGNAEPLAARPLIDVSALGPALEPGTVAHPLGGVTTDAAYLFFTAAQGLGSGGIGIARFDDAAGRFVAVSMLWTADRPSYGSAALVDGDYVYVFGGLAARFLDADAYVARAPLDSVTEPAAYEYWAGGGDYAPNADEAAPLVAAGTTPSVAYDAVHSRFLLAYVTPLASEISVRSGLAVTGPWSLPVTLGRCDLPAVDPDSFCGDVTLVPALAGGTDIAVTQAVASFSRVASAAPSDYWTRLLTASWPESLP